MILKKTFYNGKSQWTTTIWDSLFGSFSIRFFTANSSWPQGFCQKKTIHVLIQGPLFRNVVLGICFVSIGLWMQCIYGHGCFSGEGPITFHPPPLRNPRFGLHPPGKVTWLAGRFPPWMKMHFLLKMGDFSASHVSFQGCTTFWSFVFELRRWLG